jgi:hypothetical protein
VIIAVDDAGRHVREIEGGEGGTATTTEALGRQRPTTVDYRGLFIRDCLERGLPITNVLFDDD